MEANEVTHNRNRRRGTGSGRVDERRVCARKPRRVVDIMWKTGKTWAEGEETKHESVGSVAANQENIENTKEAGREALGTQG